MIYNKKLIAQFAKHVSVTLIVGTLLFTSIVTPIVSVRAEDIPTPPSIPTNTTTIPSAPPIPENTTQIPESPASPQPHPSDSPKPSASPKSNEDKTDTQNAGTSGTTATGQTVNPTSSPAASVSPTPAVTDGDTTGSQSASHGTGAQEIDTGNANSSALLTNTANTNVAGNGSGVNKVRNNEWLYIGLLLACFIF
jgi:outer membrane biosynthesis protein TonB